MQKNTISRREVIRILGLELPVLLISMDKMAGGAFGQEYVRKTYKVKPDKLLSLLNNPKVYMKYEISTDMAGKKIGTAVTDMSEEVLTATAKKSIDWNTGMIIYGINGQPFKPTSNEDFLNTVSKIKSLIENRVPLTVDLEINGKPYSYVFQYE